MIRETLAVRVPSVPATRGMAIYPASPYAPPDRLGHVLTFTWLGSPVKHRRAFQVRVQTLDGRLWSGRSASSGPHVTLRPLAPTSKVPDYLRKWKIIP